MRSGGLEFGRCLQNTSVSLSVALCCHQEHYHARCCAGAWEDGGEESCPFFTPCPPLAPPPHSAQRGQLLRAGRMGLEPEARVWAPSLHPYLWESPAWPTWSRSSAGRWQTCPVPPTESCGWGGPEGTVLEHVDSPSRVGHREPQVRMG